MLWSYLHDTGFNIFPFPPLLKLLEHILSVFFLFPLTAEQFPELQKLQ